MELTLARRTAEELIALHVPNYRFTWANGKTILGHCDFNNRQIALSRTLTVANDESQVIDTIRHEIAHAIAGPGAGHGREWKEQARRLGAVPRARAVGAVTVRDTAPWVGTCLVCGKESAVRFFRKPRNRRSCLSCYPYAFNPKYVLVFRRVS